MTPTSPAGGMETPGKAQMLADFVATLTPSPAPVRLTVTATEVQKRRFPVSGKQSPESRQLLDDKGLQDLLTTLHTPATTSPSSHVKASASNNSGSRTPVQNLRKECFIAIMASAVLATMLILALVAWLSIGHTKPYCNTPECDYYAKYLDDIANASVDPCHDFHAHVCSRWLSRDWRSVKQAVYEGFITQVASHVHKTRTASRGQSALQKAAQFFQSCVAVVSGQANELDAVKSMLSERRIMLQERAGAGTTYEDYFNRMVSAFGRGKDALSYNSLLELESLVIPRLNHSLVLPAPTTLRDQSMKVVIDASKNAIDRFAWDSALKRHLNTTAGKSSE
ncbi:hypothetical protein HPB50_021331 [Hyalomma asiaticum]|uniref:Uncharacterized protein n=1 Tax=Hyalomma asiaticum TaxID=266040 RepID=A0ACB7S8R5_HYAAI|nr:hypothetical protein HPB50_021331 [Hyalomma asiaticum]